MPLGQSILMNDVNINPLRNLPSVERVLRAGPCALAVSGFGQKLATDAIRRVLATVRPALTTGEHNVPDAAAVAAEALALLDREDIPNARRVFNLSGTVLHTNLGRAALPEAAITAAREPVAFEYDLTTGTRGERDDLVRGLLPNFGSTPRFRESSVAGYAIQITRCAA
jgi:L-seryl-tRNA(Ser) seleniumtransferase